MDEEQAKSGTGNATKTVQVKKPEEKDQARFTQMHEDLAQAKVLLAQFTQQLDEWLLKT